MQAEAPQRTPTWATLTMRTALGLLYLLFSLSAVEARTRGSFTGQYVFVHGYVRSNGTYVSPYVRAKAGTALGNSQSGHLSTFSSTSAGIPVVAGIGPISESLPTRFGDGIDGGSLTRPAAEEDKTFCPVGKLVGTGVGVCVLN